MADSGMPMNLGYVKTKPGMFKCIAVGVGLLAMAFLAATYNQGFYYYSSYGYYEEQNCKLGHPVYVDGKYKLEQKPCPIRMLVIPCVFLVAFTWAASLVLLIAYLAIDLNQKGFGKIDFILQFVFGGVFCLSVLLVGVFIVLYFLSWFPSSCEPISRSRKFARDFGRGEAITCDDRLTLEFQIVLLIIGEILTIPAGVMYIMAGLMAMKDARGQMMMAPGAQPAQVQGQPMQQTPSQYQQQSVHGSPSARTGHPSQFQQRA